MANNYMQATVSPELPARLFTDEELAVLEWACGLSGEPGGDFVYLYAGEDFCERGEDEDGREVDCVAILQGKLRQLDAGEYPHIAIHGAATCSKMRPDEFGGFAILITRDDVRSTSTWQWLHEQQEALAALPTPSA